MSLSPQFGGVLRKVEPNNDLAPKVGAYAVLQFRGILSRKPAREPLVIVGVYVTLTVLVWGLFAFSRGTWQDEVMVLHTIQWRAGDPLGQLITPRTDSTTRWLSGIPYAFAQWSGWPVFALQFLYGLTWFSIGVLVHLLANRLFPQHDWLAYIAGAVTLCATGDLTVNYVGTTSLLMSVALYFASVVCLLGLSLIHI